MNCCPPRPRRRPSHPRLTPTTLAKVVITGVGVVSPCGLTARDCFASLVEARSGITHVSPEVFGPPNQLVAGQIVTMPVLEAAGLPFTQVDRSTHFALAAVEQAMADAG